MDELKELYGIEMTTDEKKFIAVDILRKEWERTSHILDMASNAPQRIDALKKQEAIKYVLSLNWEKPNDKKLK